MSLDEIEQGLTDLATAAARKHGFDGKLCRLAREARNSIAMLHANWMEALNLSADAMDLVDSVRSGRLQEKDDLKKAAAVLEQRHLSAMTRRPYRLAKKEG